MKSLFGVLVFALICSGKITFAQSSEFYSYYTSLDYNDNNNTGKYADVIVHLNNTGLLVFSRENSYLPYWEVKGSKHFFARIIPFNGDGPPDRPDRINKCSYVRIIENSEKQIIIHQPYLHRLCQFLQYHLHTLAGVGWNSVGTAKIIKSSFWQNAEGAVTSKNSLYKSRVNNVPLKRDEFD